jgi:hypothetical protein
MYVGDRFGTYFTDCCGALGDEPCEWIEADSPLIRYFAQCSSGTSAPIPGGAPPPAPGPPPAPPYVPTNAPPLKTPIFLQCSGSGAAHTHASWCHHLLL